jgi:hypothetical protein
VKTKPSLSKILVQLPDGKEYNLPYADRRIYRTSEVQKLLPDLPGIYFYIDSDNIVQYVGITSRLNVRPLASHTFGYWTEMIAFFPFTTRHRTKIPRICKYYRSKQGGHEERTVEVFNLSPEIYYVEHLCIEWFNPKLNKTRYSKY